MATNFVQPGDSVTLTAPSGGVTAGLGYVIDNLFVVALNTAAAAASFEGGTRGVFDFVGDSADTFNEGEPVYWDAGNGRVTVVPTGSTYCGIAVANVTTPAAGTPVPVLIQSVPAYVAT